MAGQLADLFASVPEETVVIDTANYYPGMLSEPIEAVDDGQVESVYTTELLGRPVIKAWNAALAETQRTKEFRPERPAASPSPSPATPSRRGAWP